MSGENFYLGRNWTSIIFYSKFKVSLFFLTFTPPTYFFSPEDGCPKFFFNWGLGVKYDFAKGIKVRHVACVDASK